MAILRKPSAPGRRPVKRSATSATTGTRCVRWLIKTPPHRRRPRKRRSRSLAPGDQSRDGECGAEPRTYADGGLETSTVAPPAADELADYEDEGEALAADNVQQGQTHVHRADRFERQSPQGPKTVAADRDRLKGQ